MSHDPSRLDQSEASVQVSRRLVDVLLSRVIEAGVVLLWHGLWTIMDLLSDKEAWLGLSPAHSAWLSLGVGWAGGLVVLVMQVPVLLLHHRHKSRLLRCLFLISFYLFILFGVVSAIASFRGAWYLLDLYFIPESEEISQVMMMMMMIMMIMMIMMMVMMIMIMLMMI